MARRRLAVGALNDQRIEEFIKAQRGRGRSRRRLRATAVILLQQLRAAGVVVVADPPAEQSPATALLADYETYLQSERGVAESSIRRNVLFAGRFVAGAVGGDAERIGLLRAEDVGGFLLGQVRHLTPGRAQTMAIALRCFLRFLFQRGQTSTDLGRAVPTVRRWRLADVPRYLPAREVEHLLRDARSGSSAVARRDFAILLLLARLGLRAGEVTSVTLDDVRWREGVIIVRGKGGVHDRLPLVADAGRALARYLKERPPSASRRVFLCAHAPRRGFADSSVVSTIVARALTRAGIQSGPRGAHLLRHSLATTLVRRGASLAEIGEVLRHRSPSATEIYAKLDFDALRDVAMPWPTAGEAP
jgi:site-specific recombinase XerD